MHITQWYNKDMSKDVQYHLFDTLTTEYEVKEPNPEMVYDEMAKAVVHWLVKNGVAQNDYSIFIPRVLGTNVKVGSKSYNKVYKRINKILSESK